MQTVALNAGGMSCGGCVGSVTHILEGIDGVGKAGASLENRNAAVTFGPAKTDPDTLIKAVENDDFDASW